MAEPLPHHRFSVDDYERMIEVGILREDHRVELIYGEIVEMSPIGGPHTNCLNRLNRAAMRQTGEDLYVQIQSPIRIPNHRSEPQPDIAIIRIGFDERKPAGETDIVLVGEVSDSTLTYDRNVKLPLYAAAGIPEAWIFNLVARRIERHTDPQPDGYHSVAYAERGQRLSSTVLPDVVFDADEILGTAPRPRPPVTQPDRPPSAERGPAKIGRRRTASRARPTVRRDRPDSSGRRRG